MRTHAPDLSIVASGLRFPEGPVSLPDSSLLVVEIMGQALTRVWANGRKEVIAELDGGPNGAAMGPDGWCYICNSGGWRYVRDADGHRPIGQSETPGWVERVHIESGRVERLYDGTDARRLRSPNDLIFDRHGGFWFTDTGKRHAAQMDLGAVYYGHVSGAPLLEVLPTMVTANGIGLSPGGDVLYVAETLPRRIWSFNVSAPGEVARQAGLVESINGGSLLAGLPHLHNPDSLAIDSAGHIALATIIHGAVLDIGPDGVVHGMYPMPDPYPTNVCFDQNEPDVLYITLSSTGCLVRMNWPRPGLPLMYGSPGPSKDSVP